MGSITIIWNDEDVEDAEDDYDPVADMLSSLEYEGIGASAIDDAAPDLLAALKETCEALEGAALGFPPDSGQRSIYKQQVEKARAVIVKHGGRA